MCPTVSMLDTKHTNDSATYLLVVSEVCSQALEALILFCLDLIKCLVRLLHSSLHVASMWWFVICTGVTCTGVICAGVICKACKQVQEQHSCGTMSQPFTYLQACCLTDLDLSSWRCLLSARYYCVLLCCTILNAA